MDSVSAFRILITYLSSERPWRKWEYFKKYFCYCWIFQTSSFSSTSSSPSFQLAHKPCMSSDYHITHNKRMKFIMIDKNVKNLCPSRQLSKFKTKNNVFSSVNTLEHILINLLGMTVSSKPISLSLKLLWEIKGRFWRNYTNLNSWEILNRGLICVSNSLVNTVSWHMFVLHVLARRIWPYLDKIYIHRSLPVCKPDTFYTLFSVFLVHCHCPEVFWISHSDARDPGQAPGKIDKFCLMVLDEWNPAG